MKVTNENQEDTPLLTKADLAIAAYALAETFNSYLEAYEAEDFGDVSKERWEQSMNQIRTAFIKFDALAHTITKGEQNDSEV